MCVIIRCTVAGNTVSAVSFDSWFGGTDGGAEVLTSMTPGVASAPAGENNEAIAPAPATSTATISRFGTFCIRSGPVDDHDAAVFIRTRLLF